MTTVKVWLDCTGITRSQATRYGPMTAHVYKTNTQFMTQNTGICNDGMGSSKSVLIGSTYSDPLNTDNCLPHAWLVRFIPVFSNELARLL